MSASTSGVRFRRQGHHLGSLTALKCTYILNSHTSNLSGGTSSCGELEIDVLLYKTNPITMSKDTRKKMYLTTNEVAAAFGVSIHTVYRLVARQQLRAFRVGSLYRFFASEVNAFGDRQLEQGKN